MLEPCWSHAGGQGPSRFLSLVRIADAAFARAGMAWFTRAPSVAGPTAPVGASFGAGIT